MTDADVVSTSKEDVENPASLWESLRALPDEAANDSEPCAYCLKWEKRDLISWAGVAGGFRSPASKTMQFESEDGLNMRRFRDTTERRNECWFCRFISRTCATNMEQSGFVKCWTENLQFNVRRAYSCWKSDMLLRGAGRDKTKFQLIEDSGGVSFHSYQHKDPGLDRVRLFCENDNGSIPNGTFRIPHNQQDMDFDLIQAWLRACEDLHSSSTCSVRPPHSDQESLYLINVNTRSVALIEPVPEYIALSYVWGGETGDAFDAITAGCLPTNIPQTITDAIKVVIGLGKEFLWVDLYCIEKDAATRHRRIQQMDMIYEGAYLTICDLSGSSAQTGLPGISMGMQKRQTVVGENKGTRYLAISFNELENVIQRCAWSSRAWTFQESALSRRRLCFHPEGLFMLCRRAIFQDLLQFRHGSEGQIPRTDFTVPGFELELSMFSSSSWIFATYSRVIESYNYRKLTYSSDALNAVTGLLNRMCLPDGARFLQGLPSHDFHNSLLWFQRERHGYQNRSTRRENFSSWSWLGWNTHIQYGVWLVPGLPFASESDDESARNTSVYSLVDGPRVYTDLVKIHKCASFRLNSQSSGHGPEVMIASSDVVTFRVQRLNVPLDGPDADLIDMSEVWQLYESPGHPLQRKWSNGSGYSDSIFLGNGSEEIGLCSPRSGIYSFQVEDGISYEYLGRDTTTLEFILLQHWVENDAFHVPEGGYQPPPFVQSAAPHFGDRVWVMAVRRVQDDIVERVAVLWLRAENWFAASPRPITVQLR